MKKFNLFLIFFMTTSRLVLGQMDINAVNKPVELLNSANEDIENGNYTDAVQKLLAAIRLEPKIREMYLSLNTACSHTNQISILKQYLIKAKAIFEEDDEICYYLGNIYQNENNFHKAIAEYSLAISCYLKINECSKSIPDFTYALKLNPDNGAIYANRGIAYYKTGKKTEACKDWRKAQSLGIQSAGTYVRRYCR